MIDVSLSDPSLANFIEKQVPGMFNYTQTWLNTVPRLYGYEVIPVISRSQKGDVTGFLPLCLMRSRLTGRRLVSLPFSDQCPLLSEDAASANALIDQAIELAIQEKAKYLELRSGINDVLSTRSDLVRTDLYVRWLLPLTPDPEKTWVKMRKPVQHQVKKSRKQGVQVHVAECREEVEQYYRLHLQTRSKKHGMPSQPRRYFYNLWDAFARDRSMQLLLADHQGKVIAGMVLLAAGSTIRYAYGASDDRYLSLAPNNLLMWTAIEMGCRQGFRTFDMGRTARDNEGLMEYKRRWGAIEESLPYYYYPHMAGLASTSESSWKYQILTSNWKRLPLALAGSLGGYLYRHLG
jgi:FemAB-related protein (PEP-CTERM system-associated)